MAAACYKYYGGRISWRPGGWKVDGYFSIAGAPDRRIAGLRIAPPFENNSLAFGIQNSQYEVPDNVDNAESARARLLYVSFGQ